MELCCDLLARMNTVKPLINISRILVCWSLRCSWNIACRRCSNYIFILELTPGFRGLGKYNFKTKQETNKFCDLVQLILQVWRHIDSSRLLNAIYLSIWLQRIRQRQLQDETKNLLVSGFDEPYARCLTLSTNQFPKYSLYMPRM